MYSGNYGMLWFFLWSLLVELWIYDMILTLYNTLDSPLFWLLESYYIIMTDILWHDLYRIHAPLLRCQPRKLLSRFSPVPTSLWTTYYVWTLYLTLQIIMILQHLKREPIKSVHWTCKHDLCSSPTPLETRLSSTAFERHKVREKIIWAPISSQTWVTWLPWGGRKGISSNKLNISPSPIVTTAYFWKPRINSQKTMT